MGLLNFTILPSNERVVYILKYMPTKLYEYNNKISLISTSKDQYVLKIFAKDYIENNKEVEFNSIISKYNIV